MAINQTNENQSSGGADFLSPFHFVLIFSEYHSTLNGGVHLSRIHSLIMVHAEFAKGNFVLLRVFLNVVLF